MKNYEEKEIYAHRKYVLNKEYQHLFKMIYWFFKYKYYNKKNEF